MSGLARGCHEVDAGIADRRRASVRYQCNVTLSQAFEYLRDAAAHVVVRVADQLRVQAVMPQKNAGGASVLRSHEGHLRKDPQCPQADVLQIADRRGHNV